MTLPLPETVEATLADTDTPAQIPVKWTDDDGYDGEAPGEYGFTGLVSNSYLLEEDVAAPVLTVTVTADTDENSSENQPEEPPCTINEGCTLPDEHEGACIPPARGQL